MSQYGAQGWALEDPTVTGQDIVTHYYLDSSVELLTDKLPADHFLLAYPEPLWVGLAYSPPPLTFSFEAIGGDLTLCQKPDGTGGCANQATALDGETWSFTSTFDGSCQFFQGGTALGARAECSATISWEDGTRVRLPDIPDGDYQVARGTLQMRPAPDGIGFHVSLAISLEDYLAGIDEMPASWEPAALEAQALAARSYAVTRAIQRELDSESDPDQRVGPLFDPVFTSFWSDWCHCHIRRTSIDQNYDAWEQEQRQAWVDAAAATAGLVVTHDDPDFTEWGVAETFYASSTFGKTESNTTGFGSSSQYPYLVPVDDRWSADGELNPLATWTKDVLPATIIDALAAANDRAWHVDFDALLKISLSSPPPGAVVAFTGTVSGTKVTVEVPGWWLRGAVGLRSPQITDVSWPSITRLAGADRYETAAEVSKAKFGGNVPVVYVATGENFPDALAGAPAAAAEGGPMLLVRQDSIPAATVGELTRLAPQQVVILGGTGVVSAGVEERLGAYAGSVVRRSGPTRFETAVEISRGVFEAPVPVVYVTTGFDFPEAVVGGPAAAARGGPVLLVRPDRIPTATRQELDRLQPQEIVVIGPPGDVSDGVMAGLDAYTTGTVTRIAGSDRYYTAVRISASVFGAGVSTVYVAVGDDFPDALTGGPAAGIDGGPVLFVRRDSIPDPIAAELARLRPRDIVILGGTGVISVEVEKALVQYLD